MFPLPVLSVFALLRLLYSQAIIYKNRLKRLLLKIEFNFKEITTANCSVPMPKRPSDEAGPSH